VFTGEYQYKVDEKGRVPFPPKFREQLKGGFVLARGERKCITVYPMALWEKLSDKLDVLPPAPTDVMEYKDLLFGTAFETEFDGQGRVSLPAPLRQHAEIDNAVVLSGSNNTLLIWSKENWEQISEDAGAKMRQISERVKEQL
jgi:MraZ protein